MRWGVPFRASGPRPDSQETRSEDFLITMEEIVSTLRLEVYLGEAQNVAICVCRAGDSRIGEAIGKTEYPRLIPGAK